MPVKYMSREARPFVSALSVQQRFVVAVLAFLQFTVILDFVVLAPLGAVLMPALSITPGQFGVVVSVYAFSAAVSGLLAAGFADHFDRKRFLLVFYAGFLVGTLFCGVVRSYELLLLARGVTGMFGGVLGSIVATIAADLFSLEVRGRVMGYIQAAFAASRVLGIPVALALSTHLGWQSPFLVIASVGAVVWLVISWKLDPMKKHVDGDQPQSSPLRHFAIIVQTPRYWLAFVVSALLTTGGFMLMPYSSAFSVHNLGVAVAQLPTLYFAAGVFTMAMGPLVGGFADRFGKFRVFMVAVISSVAMVTVYTRLSETPFWIIVVLNTSVMVAVSARMIPAQALLSAVPPPEKRGAFMAVNSSIQQACGGVASLVAGLLVSSRSDGALIHFDRVGLVVAASSFIALLAMHRVTRLVTVDARNY
jgi:predicted MFS family arabinose efflux permease